MVQPKFIRCTEGYQEIVWISPQTPSAERWFDGLPVERKQWRPWGPEFCANLFRTPGAGRTLFLWNVGVHPASPNSLRAIARELRPGDRLALLYSPESASANAWLHEMREAGFEALRSTALGGGFQFGLYRRPVRWAPVPSLSIVVPVCDDAANVSALLSRLAGFDAVETEVLFVEGHSRDNSWSAIGRLRETYDGHFKIRALRQPGLGRADALSWGFSRAEGKVFATLGAHLQSPPESLCRLFEAFVEGRSDVIFGDRFRLPVEGAGLPFAARWSQRILSSVVSLAAGKPIPDVSSGMYVLSALDYRSVLRWRGRLEKDWELLLGASALGLTLLSLPVPFKRTLAQTKAGLPLRDLVRLFFSLPDLIREHGLGKA